VLKAINRYGISTANQRHSAFFEQLTTVSVEPQGKSAAGLFLNEQMQ
jgi:hypothetical protein